MVFLLARLLLLHGGVLSVHDSAHDLQIISGYLHMAWRWTLEVFSESVFRTSVSQYQHAYQYNRILSECSLCGRGGLAWRHKREAADEAPGAPTK